MLTFNHTDASGTAAQETGVSGYSIFESAGEYSTLGRNVADAGHYISLNTYEGPDEGGNMNMFGSGQNYRLGFSY